MLHSILLCMLTLCCGPVDLNPRRSHFIFVLLSLELSTKTCRLARTGCPNSLVVWVGGWVGGWSYRQATLSDNMTKVVRHYVDIQPVQLSPTSLVSEGHGSVVWKHCWGGGVQKSRLDPWPGKQPILFRYILHFCEIYLHGISRMGKFSSKCL